MIFVPEVAELSADKCDSSETCVGWGGWIDGWMGGWINTDT